MEAASTNADWGFLTKKPFGMLMAAQTVFSFIVVVMPVFSPFIVEGGYFTASTALSLLISSLILNALHVFGINRRAMSLGGNAAIFIPCTLILFFMSLIFGILFCFSTLIFVIAFFESFKYTFRYMLAVAITLILVLGLAYVCLQLVVLLFRAAPNSRVMGLSQVVIEGERTELLNAATFPATPTNPPSNPQFSV